MALDHSLISAVAECNQCCCVFPIAEEKELSRRGHVGQDQTHGISHDPVNIFDYEEGRAEALGALCSIFTSQPCGEAFLSVYLARFYHALTVGLQYQENVSACVCVCVVMEL